MGSKVSTDRRRVEVGGVGNDRTATEEVRVPTPEEFGKRVDDFIARDAGRNEAEAPATQKEPTDTGVRGVGDVTGTTAPAATTDDAGDGARELSDYVNDLLQKAGKQLGEEGFIFVGGLIPYKRTNSGGWEIDTDKETIRISNINEAQSARVAMGLMAYLIEEMQGDLAKELGVEAIPGLENQVPS